MAVNTVSCQTEPKKASVGGGRLPDFIIIGAPKCGTTTLYDWLRRHPKIHMPFKELGFFSQDIFPTDKFPMHISSLDDYMAMFADAPNPNVLCGEATPRYLYSDQAITEIARLPNEPKVIVCLRDPVQLVISYHNQKLKEGREPETDLMKAWQRTFDQNRKPISVAPELNGLINYFFWGRVGERLAKLFEHFREERVKIIFLADLHRKPRDTYLEVLKFLSLSDDGRHDFETANERVRVRNLLLNSAVLRLKETLEPMLASVRKYRGGRGLGLLKVLNAINTQRGEYIGDISHAQRTQMYEALESDIRIADIYLKGRKLVERKLTHE